MPTAEDPEERLDQLFDRDDAATNFFPQLWHPKYAEQFPSLVRQSIQYGCEEIKKRFKKISTSGHDVVVTLKRATDESVHLRGDFRYASTEMGKFLLDTGYDLLPPYVGLSASGYHLLDGHHRWRAYLMAGMAPLVLQIEIQPSRGPTPKLICQYDSSVGNKIVTDEEQNRKFRKFLSDFKEQMTVRELRSLVSEAVRQVNRRKRAGV